MRGHFGVQRSLRRERERERERERQRVDFIDSRCRRSPPGPQSPLRLFPGAFNRARDTPLPSFLLAPFPSLLRPPPLRVHVPYIAKRYYVIDDRRSPGVPKCPRAEPSTLICRCAPARAPLHPSREQRPSLRLSCVSPARCMSFLAFLAQGGGQERFRKERARAGPP